MGLARGVRPFRKILTEAGKITTGAVRDSPPVKAAVSSVKSQLRRYLPSGAIKLFSTVGKLAHHSFNNDSLPFHASSLASGFDAAYKEKDGYYIRVDPDTQKKIMYVAGSRSTGDWSRNAFDVFAMGINKAERKYLAKKNGEIPIDFLKFDFTRNKKVQMLDSVARREGVDIAIGHSRGAALVGDMQYPNQKIGMDGAMVINRDKTMPNYIEGGFPGIFDEIIASSGKNNFYADQGSVFHKVWA